MTEPNEDSVVLRAMRAAGDRVPDAECHVVLIDDVVAGFVATNRPVVRPAS